MLNHNGCPRLAMGSLEPWLPTFEPKKTINKPGNDEFPKRVFQGHNYRCSLQKMTEDMIKNWVQV